MYISLHVSRLNHYNGDLDSADFATGTTKAQTYLYTLCSPQGQMRQRRALFKLYKVKGRMLI